MALRRQLKHGSRDITEDLRYNVFSMEEFKQKIEKLMVEFPGAKISFGMYNDDMEILLTWERIETVEELAKREAALVRAKELERRAAAKQETKERGIYEKLKQKYG